MVLGYWRSFLIVLLCIFIFFGKSYAQKEYEEKRIKVTIRTIGHRFLQKVGDSTSRVLPITQSNNQYVIKFERDVQFYPDQLIEAIDDVIEESKVAEAYIVEVTTCKSGEVVYSYEIDSVSQLNEISCRGREYPKACYTILLTLKYSILNYPMKQGANSTAIVKPDHKRNIVYAVGLLSLFFIGVFIFIKKRRKEEIVDQNLLAIGRYQFDKRNATLSLDGVLTELSGKETDLLLLLHENANETLDRDLILNKVWGDEGDYIGRTLDVFISKLRKKIEDDPDIKIVNIRGVGYKLVAA